MIPFNIPPYVGKEDIYIKDAVRQKKICGDGKFTKKCSEWLEKQGEISKALLTTSCTHALELAAILCDIQAGDEVIMPSYTFVSTANAFVLRGAVPVFVDIRPDTMNMDETLIENAITPKTKVIVPVHYAGVSCEMDTIMNIAKRYHIRVVEDAAQGVMSSYKGKALGTIGHFGCYSFHETKNYSMGEGGALLIRDEDAVLRAEIIREKGTNRSAFFRGMVDKYTWIEQGSSYLPSELNAAYLYAQLEMAEQINEKRLSVYRMYRSLLAPLEKEGKLELPVVPEDCEHNGHMFYFKVKDLEERTRLQQYLRECGIGTAFHYIPLHSSPAGKKYGRFSGEDKFTTKESERLLRLPMYYQITYDEVERVVDAVGNFWHKKREVSVT